MVLGFVTDLPPLGMVTELLSPFGVAAGCLQVTIGEGADPDLAPGGRNGELSDSAKVFVIVKRFLVRGKVAEPVAATHPPNAGIGVVGISQTCRPR